MWQQSRRTRRAFPPTSTSDQSRGAFAVDLDGVAAIGQGQQGLDRDGEHALGGRDLGVHLDRRAVGGVGAPQS